MKPGRQKNKQQQQKENPHTLTDYMIKNSLVYVTGECSSFFARKLGFPSRLLPRTFTWQHESTPGITIPPATQAEKFTSLVIFIH